MNEKPNPFKALESNAGCPPDLRDDLLTEIDWMRNVLMVADTYTYNTAAVLTAFMDGLSPTDPT